MFSVKFAVCIFQLQMPFSNSFRDPKALAPCQLARLQWIPLFPLFNQIKNINQKRAKSQKRSKRRCKPAINCMFLSSPPSVLFILQLHTKARKRAFAWSCECKRIRYRERKNGRDYGKTEKGRRDTYMRVSNFSHCFDVRNLRSR